MNKSETLPSLNYSFHSPVLLEEALTHSSLMLRRPDGSPFHNERLEFLGDSVLNAIIAEELFRRLPTVEEGNLTRLRAQVICENALATTAGRIGLGNYIRLGRSEENNGGRERQGLVADALEAVIGALYIDGGWPVARRFVLETMADCLDQALAGNLRTDYKTEIQERLQAIGVTKINYQLDQAIGPDHCKVFYVSLWAGAEKLGNGSGRSKKEAEQAAAHDAILNRP